MYVGYFITNLRVSDCILSGGKFFLYDVPELLDGWRFKPHKLIHKFTASFLILNISISSLFAVLE
jgi:hypothetical protein